MTIFRTFTDTERAALKLHGLDTHRPSQLSDAFVLGMRHAGPERRAQIAAACGEVFGWAKPDAGAVTIHETIPPLVGGEKRNDPAGVPGRCNCSGIGHNGVSPTCPIHAGVLGTLNDQQEKP